MPVPGLSLLGLKRIRGFVSILRYINPTIIIRVFANSTGVHIADRNKQNVSTEKKQCTDINKVKNMGKNFIVATHNRFNVLAELADETSFNIEQCVNVDNTALSECKVDNEKPMCKDVEVSQVQESETIVNHVDTTDTTAIVREVLQGKGNKSMRKVNVHALKDKTTDLKHCLSQ